jgi:hypothetical protein
MVHPSSAMRMVTVIFLLVLARSQPESEDSLLLAPPISSWLFLSWRRAPALALAYDATMEVDEEPWRGGSWRSGNRAEANRLWSGQRSDAACGCGTMAVFVAWSPELRRPLLRLMGGLRCITMPLSDRMAVIFIPPGRSATREAAQPLDGVHGALERSGGDLVAPSGLVPGGGRVHSGWGLLGTRLLFFLLVGGPSCKKAGTSLYFIVFLESCCNMCACTVPIK